MVRILLVLANTMSESRVREVSKARARVEGVRSGLCSAGPVAARGVALRGVGDAAWMRSRDLMHSRSVQDRPADRAMNYGQIENSGCDLANRERQGPPSRGLSPWGASSVDRIEFNRSSRARDECE